MLQPRRLMQTKKQNLLKNLADAVSKLNTSTTDKSTREQIKSLGLFSAQSINSLNIAAMNQLSKIPIKYLEKDAALFYKNTQFPQVIHRSLTPCSIAL